MPAASVTASGDSKCTNLRTPDSYRHHYTAQRSTAQLRAAQSSTAQHSTAVSGDFSRKKTPTCEHRTQRTEALLPNVLAKPSTW